MRIRDWSSDVCSSDLHIFSGASQAIIERSHNLVPAHHPDDLSRPEAIRPHTRAAMVDTDRHAVHAQGIYTANDKVGAGRCPAQQVDRKGAVWGKSVYDGVDLGGTRSIKKKKQQ